MSTNLQNIDLVKERANVSYEDAKDALEKCNNDVVDSLVYLEKQNKIKSGEKVKCESTVFNKIKELVKKGNSTRFIIKKKENALLNICVTFAAVITVVAFPAVIAVLILALITNHKIRFEKANGESIENVNEVFDKMSASITSVTNKIVEDK